MATEYRKVTREEARAELQKPMPTLVLIHARPDGDAIGSGFALAHFLKKNGSPALVFSADEIPSHLSFLAKGVQESIRFENMPAGFENARVITVDVAAPGQLDRLYELFEGKIALMIDHHGVGEVYADHLVDPGAAAACEIVFDITCPEGICPDKELATWLYAGICGDTGSFRYSNTTPKTLRIAAALVESGLDVAEINRRLFDAKSFEMLRAERAAFDRMQFFKEGKIAVVSFPYELKVALKCEEEHLATLVDVPRTVRGVEVAAAIRQPGEAGEFRVSLRANGDYDVASVAAVFGGGGHKRAAGATLQAENIDQAVKMIAEELQKLL